MKINIQPKDFKAKPELLDFVVEKTGKIYNFYEKAISCDVVLKTDKSDKDTNKVCAMQLVIPGYDLLSRAQCSTFEEAVMLCIDILKRQLDKKKTKRKKMIVSKRVLSVFE